MNIKIPFIALFAVVLLASCSHVYTPALYHQDIAYQPKPTSFDTSKSKTYISAGLNSYTSVNFADLLESGQVNLSRGHVFNNFNVAYGAFAVFGDYNNSTTSNSATNTQPNNFTDKFFGTVGGRASVNLFVKTSSRVDFRFIGVEVAYSHEFGSYANFRQTIKSSPDYEVDPRTDLVSLGLTSEMIFNSADDELQHGIRGFLGSTFGYNNLSETYYKSNYSSGRFLKNIFPKASYFIRFKNYFGTVEAGSQFFIRFGLQF